ncbi:MAG: RidA family protein [Anaerolineaceae bacterium]|nr:RidA family protein [Anaerolineaceae bacterium]
MKQPVVAQNAPKAIGPYSAAVKTGFLIFTAGQLGMDPQTGQLVEGGIQAQTKQALINLKEILIAAGSDLTKVVKVTVFLQNMAEFSLMNEIYAEFFSREFPARSAIQVAALPKNAAVEIEAIALP